MKTVTFGKDHVFSGRLFKKGEKLHCDDERAKMLEDSGVLEKPQKIKDKK